MKWYNIILIDTKEVTKGNPKKEIIAKIKGKDLAMKTLKLYKGIYRNSTNLFIFIDFGK